MAAGRYPWIRTSEIQESSPFPQQPLARLIYTGLNARTGMVSVSIDWYVLLSESIDVNSDINKTLRMVEFVSDLYTTRHTAARFRIARQDLRVAPRAHLHCSQSSCSQPVCRDEQRRRSSGFDTDL